jgi:hypothetical protein
VSFLVRRRCKLGACPVSDGACDCSDTQVDVDVDELDELEAGWFWQFGTLEQRAELDDYFGKYVVLHRSGLAPVRLVRAGDAEPPFSAGLARPSEWTGPEPVMSGCAATLRAQGPDRQAAVASISRSSSSRRLASGLASRAARS